jgi:REP element-mobilizing transposase RayT
MSRGGRREKIFLDDVDRQDFLKTPAGTWQKTGFLAHASCLLPNHFHLVVQTPEANRVAGRAWLWSTCTIRFNQRHKLSGHLFSGRYKALVVEGSGTGYLKTVGDYVHLNPVRTKLLAAEAKFAGDPWSSRLWHGAAREPRPAWLGVARLLGEPGCRKIRPAAGKPFWRGWKRAAGRKSRRSRWLPFGVVGAWAARPFGRNFWPSSTAKPGNGRAASCGKSMEKAGRSGSSPGSGAGGLGRRKHWVGHARIPQGKWPSPPGCGEQRR